MKLFVRYIIIFSLLVITLVTAAEVYVEHIPNPARDKHAWMVRNSNSVETLLLGNSHIYYGVCPDSIGTNTFSLALTSQTYRYDWWLLQHYDMPNLRTVVLNFSYFSLWEDMEHQPQSAADIVRYRLYMNCDIHPRLSRYGFEFSFIPAFREKLKSLWQAPKMTWNEHGWGTNFTLDRRATEWDDGENRARINTYHDEQIVNFNLTFLDGIADFCSARNIRLLLVSTPTTATFAQYQDKRQTSRNNTEINNFLKRHPEVEYYDFQLDTRFDADDFFDADHLNSDGAVKLAKILRGIIYI